MTRRITIELSKSASDALYAMIDLEDLNASTVFNRAVLLYADVVGNQAKGSRMWREDPQGNMVLYYVIPPAADEDPEP